MKWNHWKRLVLLVVPGVAVFLLNLLQLDEYLSLDFIKSNHSAISSIYTEHPTVVLTCYFLLYIFLTALSLPGATVLTLAAGGVFGFVTALVVVSFASSIGATFSCALSRFVLRDAVQTRLGDRLAAVNAGMDRDGAFYLFSLRLVPVLPFFMVNLLMGLTRMPLHLFYWVSQIGALPATAVYVNAGRELWKIQSPWDILSPGLVLSFAALAVFPLIARKMLAAYRCRDVNMCALERKVP